MESPIPLPPLDEFLETSSTPQSLILNTKQDYQHFHQPTPLAPLLHNYRNAPIQPIPIPFLLLPSNSFLSISLTQLLHPLYNKHSPHKPFTSTTIQRQSLAIAHHSLSSLPNTLPHSSPSSFSNHTPPMQQPSSFNHQSRTFNQQARTFNL